MWGDSSSRIMTVHAGNLSSLEMEAGGLKVRGQPEGLWGRGQPGGSWVRGQAKLQSKIVSLACQ